MNKDEYKQLYEQVCEQYDVLAKELAAIKQTLAAPTVQEPVATVIEELEHDGEGFCAKVRWLYNPVPVGETLSWEQPK